MAKIFPVDFEEKLTMAQDDYILFSDSEDGNKIKKAQYSNLKWEQGDPGTPGTDWAAATITVGTVTTWVPGSSATVTNSGTSSAAVLNFSIPQWAKWEPWEDGEDWTPWADWEAATITVGTTTTLSPWSSATVTNVGTSSAAILNFWIPQGTPWTWTGDVIWPASSTDWHLAVFDWATGKLIKDWGSVPTSFAPDSAGTQWQVLTKWASGYDWATVSGWDVQVSTDTGNLLSTGVKLWLGDKADFDNLWTLDTNTIYAPITWMGGGGWWSYTPTAYTVAYYPLISDFNDHKWSWTLYNLTNSWATLATLWWVTCANFNWSDTEASSSAFYSYWTWDFTASARGYPLANSQWVWWLIGANVLVMNSKNWYVEWTSAPTPLNTWTNIVFTITGGKLKIYSNATLYLDTSYGSNVTWNLYIGATNGSSYHLYWWLSELIFENKARTATEVSDYFNATKSNYGIS